MIQHPVLGSNNGERESYLQQTDSNSQSENSRNLELVNANLPQSIPLPPAVPKINPATVSRFYRTRMCRQFLDGYCINGDNCNYAHDYNDLRQLPPNRQKLVNHERGETRESSVTVVQTLPDLSGICYNWTFTGRCRYADNCRFIHGLPEVQTSVGRRIDVKTPPTKSTTTVLQQEDEAKGFARSAIKKLKGIYADWIDEE